MLNFIRRFARGLTTDQKRRFRPLQRLWARLSCGTSLSALATFYGSDKNEAHHYTEHYERHFRPLRRRRFTVLEIGIGGYDGPTEGGRSLRMWRDYFPRSMIHGIDIHDKTYHDERRIKTHRGSQADPVFLQSVIQSMGTPDIIIDDGSHRPEHVIASFNVLFPLLAPNGIYAIEDTQTSYWPEFGGHENDLNDPATTMGFFKRLADGLNVEEFRREGYQPTYFDRHITALHFYHNLIFVQKGLNQVPPVPSPTEGCPAREDTRQ